MHSDTIAAKMDLKMLEDQEVPNVHTLNSELNAQYTRQRLWQHTHRQQEAKEFALLQRAILSSQASNTALSMQNQG